MDSSADSKWTVVQWVYARGVGSVVWDGCTVVIVCVWRGGGECSVCVWECVCEGVC